MTDETDAGPVARQTEGKRDDHLLRLPLPSGTKT
jgi:hypothetical protein